ncbi:MAG: hypothetical protein JXR97_04335 [Planctomycetes bacterium]|nr:hypothetical protein [Planctomycetota bacterium]
MKSALRLKRLVGPAIILSAAGIAAGGWNWLVKSQEERRSLERDEAYSSIMRSLELAQGIGIKYCSERMKERAEAAKRLESVASSAAGQIQVRLLAALNERQAKLAHIQAEKSERDRKMLVAIARRQAGQITELKKQVDDKGGRRTSRRGKDEEQEEKKEEGLPDIELDLLADFNSIDVEKDKGDASEKAPAETFASPPVDTEKYTVEADKSEGNINAIEDGLPVITKELQEEESRLTQSDWPQQMLISLKDELKDILPASSKLNVSQSDGKSILSLNAIADKNGVSASGNRNFVFQKDGLNEKWIISVEVSDPAAPALPDKDELVALLSGQLREVDGIDSRGLLIDTVNRKITIFPKNAPGIKTLALPDKGKWVEVAESATSITRLETSVPDESGAWAYGVQLTVDDSDAESRALHKLKTDGGYMGAIGAVILMFATGVYLTFIHVGVMPPAVNHKPAAAKQAAKNTENKIRLVRNGERAVADDAGLIMAEINSAGEGEKVTVRELPKRKAGYRSLAKLQALHRGSSLARGSCVLDLARSPILRELVRKVRPRAQAVSRHEEDDSNKDILASISERSAETFRAEARARAEFRHHAGENL